MSKRNARPVRPLGRRVVHKLADGRRVEVFEGPPLNGHVVTADVETVLAALQRFDPDMSWKRAREQVPPGILVSFGIDIGPAITFVSTELLRRWRVDPASLAAAALANLRELARSCGPADVLHDHIADVPVSVVQTGQGIAASLLLVPESVERLLGRDERLLLAPMRDILIALPPDVDREFARWLAEEWEAMDPNHLHLGGFRYRAGTVVPESIDEALAQA
jgi:hypothetical protein